MFSAVGNSGKSVWNTHKDKLGITKTNWLNYVGKDGTGYLTSLGIMGWYYNGGVVPATEFTNGWRHGKGVLSHWYLEVHGDRIFGHVGDLTWADTQLGGSVWERFDAVATDDEFDKGGIGLFTISQPTKFSDVVIKTTRALTLQEIIARTTWNSDEVNIIANFNNRKEDELSTQACVDAFNSKDIHYEQITTSANASDVNTFLSKIGNRGKYVESSNYNTYMSQVTDYIVTYVRNHT